MPLVMRSFSAYRRSLRPDRRRCRWLLRERPGEHSPRLAACRGARGRHQVRSGKIKTSSAERAWVLPSRLTGRASPGKAQWQLRPRSAYRRLREEWCEQAEGAGLLDGLTVYRQTRTLPGRSQEDFEIVVFQPPGQLTLDGTFGPFKARASYLLEPAASG